jgi:hypothetical protein
MGNAYLEMLKSYMADNATHWTGYVAPTGNFLNRDNTSHRTFWA